MKRWELVSVILWSAVTIEGLYRLFEALGGVWQ